MRRFRVIGIDRDYGEYQGEPDIIIREVTLEIRARYRKMPNIIFLKELFTNDPKEFQTAECTYVVKIKDPQ